MNRPDGIDTAEVNHRKGNLAHRDKVARRYGMLLINMILFTI
jgi:hypothetical protein